MKFKQLAHTALWIILAGFFVLITSFTVLRHYKSKCRAVEIEISYPSEDTLIDVQDILKNIHISNDSLKTIPLKKIDCKKLESLILENPYVLESRVYTSISGNLHLEATQKTPIIHIFPKSGSDYFIDKNGNEIPAKAGKAARTIIINGSITRNDSLLNKNILDLYQKINESQLLSTMISQIFIEKDKKIILIPALGSHFIEFGTIENSTEKLSKLQNFYSRGPGKNQWSKYKKINLEFENQIVCTKR